MNANRNQQEVISPEIAIDVLFISSKGFIVKRLSGNTQGLYEEREFENEMLNTQIQPLALRFGILYKCGRIKQLYSSQFLQQR